MIPTPPNGANDAIEESVAAVTPKAEPPQDQSPGFDGRSPKTLAAALCQRLLSVTNIKTIVLLAAIGASVGFCAFGFGIRPKLEAYVGQNRLSWKLRYWLQWTMIGGVMVSLVAAGALWLRTRRTQPQTAALWTRRLAPLTGLAFLPTLTDSRVWQGNELAILVLVNLFSLTILKSIVTSQDAALRLSVSPKPRSVLLIRVSCFLERQATFWGRQQKLPLLTVFAGVAVYAVYFSFHTIQTHYRLGTQSFDLALEDNLVWNAVNGGPLFKMSPFGGPDATHAGNHQTYFAFVIGLIYRFFPGPQTLLIVQAVLMGAAAIPLFYLGRSRLGPWSAAAIAWLYLLYPPLHGAALYDFHYLPLGTVFLWAALAFVEARRPLLMVLSIVLAASVREDVNAMMAVLGLLLIVEGKHVPAGLLFTAIGGLAFGILKFVVMPRYTGGHQSFVHQYQDLVPKGGAGYPAVLVTIFTNPVYTLKTLLEGDKLIYVLQIFTPLAFFPLRRAVGFLGCLVGFFFTLLSTRYPPQIQISFQYTTYWTTFLFVLLVNNLSWVRTTLDTTHKNLSRAYLAVVVCATMVCSYQYGALLETRNTRGGFGQYRFGLKPEDHERHRQVYELIGLVPNDAKIVASELLVPHVSSRKDAYTLRTGYFDAEYALFEMPTHGDEGRALKPALASGTFGVVAIRGNYALAKRRHPSTKNGLVLDRIHGD